MVSTRGGGHRSYENGRQKARMEDVEAVQFPAPRHFRMEDLEGVVKFTPVLPERGKLDVSYVMVSSASQNNLGV